MQLILQTINVKKKKEKQMNDKYIGQRFVKSYMRLREERTQVHDISGKMSVHQSVGVCN